MQEPVEAVVRDFPSIRFCPVQDWLCYSGSPEALAVLSWIGFAVTLVGLAIALWQLAKVRDAAESASTAIGGLKAHLDGVNLAYVSAQLNTISIVTRASDFVLAQSLFSPIKRSLRLQAHTLGLSNLELDGLNRNIGLIDKHLEWGRAGLQKYSATITHRSLDALLGLVTGWEGQMERAARAETSGANH